MLKAQNRRKQSKTGRYLKMSSTNRPLWRTYPSREEKWSFHHHGKTCLWWSQSGILEHGHEFTQIGGNYPFWISVCLHHVASITLWGDIPFNILWFIQYIKTISMKYHKKGIKLDTILFNLVSFNDRSESESIKSLGKILWVLLMREKTKILFKMWIFFFLPQKKVWTENISPDY